MEKPNIKIEDRYESRLYMGSETFFNDEKFSQEEVEDFIATVQDGYDIIIPVRVTPITFVSGSKYKESGWEVSAINYPKVEATPSIIDSFMKYLAEKLLDKFNQHTICVMDSEFVTMLRGAKYYGKEEKVLEKSD
tara:strand:+ start:301 stop:705 length:405 start_codon:yes stop_codon:yes gene_type:complete